ncbi:MAG: hypothetical protein BMS9Abin37_2049 [Acidobacteriota bacterium]|nr:MAG: hypothetical protein BMS9Abin37_2049 [Acidobacteriota bacterium]
MVIRRTVTFEQSANDAIEARDELEQVARREHRCPNFVGSTVCGLHLDENDECLECDLECDGIAP